MLDKLIINKKQVVVCFRDNVDCHPSLIDFEPQLIKRGKIFELIITDGAYRSGKHQHKVSTELLDNLSEYGYVLLQVEMKRWSGYGFNGNGLSYANYLIGIDHGKYPWIHRVQSNILKIDQALAWLQPKEVTEAILKHGFNKNKIKRQGDFWFIPSRVMNLKALVNTRHQRSDSEGKIYITHPEHKKLLLPGNYKAIKNKTVSSGRRVLD
jgi:hypothetical protein